MQCGHVAANNPIENANHRVRMRHMRHAGCTPVGQEPMPLKSTSRGVARRNYAYAIAWSELRGGNTVVGMRPISQHTTEEAHAIPVVAGCVCPVVVALLPASNKTPAAMLTHDPRCRMAWICPHEPADPKAKADRQMPRPCFQMSIQLLVCILGDAPM